MHLESSVIISSPIEKVYEIAETYPTFVKFYTVKSIVENTDNKIVVDVGYKLCGLPVCWSGVGEKRKYNSISYTQTKGFLKGMTANWSFSSLGGKTEVRIDIEIKKTIPFLNWFIKNTVQNITDSILLDLKNTIEKKNI